jgi:Glycosyltransferase family 87
MTRSRPGGFGLCRPCREGGFAPVDENGRRWFQVALAVWAVVLIVICARVLWSPRARSLYPTWAAAGRDWVAGVDLYHGDLPPHLDAYRYGPPIGGLMAPLAVLPERLGGVIWRLGNVAAFLGAFAWWMRVAAPVPSGGVLSEGKISLNTQGVLYLLLLPLALGPLNNAQPNLLLAGLVLAGLAATARRRWNIAAFCLAGAVMLKLYPIALALLICLVYPRRFLPRFLLALLALLALPFLLQEPDYVLRQYRLWWVERLQSGDEARRFWPPHMAYRDLWLLLRNVGVPITLRIYQILQLGSALFCAVFAIVVVWRGTPTRPILFLTLTLATCWMMLCGPATESSTYILLAPPLAWMLVVCWGQPCGALARGLITLAGALLLVAVLVGVGPFASAVHGLGIHPLATVLFVLGFLSGGWRCVAGGWEIRTQGGEGNFPKLFVSPEERVA